MLYTGTIYVRGQRMVRPELRRRTENLAGLNAPDSSMAVTVLVSGETWSGPLTDEARRYSRKASFIERVRRTTDRHVHVIDSAGYEALLDGGHARCYELTAHP
ncbi:hypothetical protein [Cellulomonas xiejunii]|uniref:Uncharacterized protein n=1 Tax=Cellulomonas xiejunii TaxID=2968083 RepID=A0ABY5KQ07_9CELL|nr:hypothetical protein [Cellulomonas xiejunii]MCC2321353.1 hypothetical protein [Cellulomonas xiejunii]UUI71938.1 hypothetical protein NP048_00215 [Cellulomonas xiejunii]